MHRETEAVRVHLKTLSPAERARLARQTEEDMRFPHHRGAEAQGGENEQKDGASLGGFLVSGEQGDHLPTTRGGKPDHQLMGAAWAALHEGYRGNKYAGPDKRAALEKLIQLYRREGLPLPGQTAPAGPER